MRFHILGLPHTATNKAFNACAYTQKALKFGKMMTARGHEVIHYGHEDSDLICTEHVTCLTQEDWRIAYGDHDWRKEFFKFNMGDHAYQTFFRNAIAEVGKRKQPGDFILPFWGSGGRPVCDAYPDLICVEPGIGYSSGYWANYKVFESYALLHAYCGERDKNGSIINVATCKQSWYDVVIPNYFDTEEFEYKAEKGDYFLYLGRVYSGKGVHIAIETTSAIGAKLIVAGQGSLDEFNYLDTSHVEHVGYADIETRKRLMANAKGVIMPSGYLEPFGGVQVEAFLSGTPVISVDWGAFSEVNIHGVTGYRCRTFNDFCIAAENIHRISPADCRAHGESFSLEAIAPRYERFFHEVSNIHGKKGWYERHDFLKEHFLSPKGVLP